MGEKNPLLHEMKKTHLLYMFSAASQTFYIQLCGIKMFTLRSYNKAKILCEKKIDWLIDFCLKQRGKFGNIAEQHKAKKHIK